jgi:hypothetical protein
MRDGRRALMLVAAVVGVLGVVVGYVMAVRPGPNTRAAGPGPVPSPTAHGDGLSDSHDGYLMRAVSLPAARGRDVPISFRSLGPRGDAQLDYEIMQTQPLHLYLVRDDLSGYQHLHPTLDGEVWTARADISDGGAYRVYAEFTPEGRGQRGHPTTLGLPFVITGDTTVAPLPGPAASVTVGEYTISRRDGMAHLRAGQDAVLWFDVAAPAGTPVLEPHLGALAHMSAFEVRTLALTHAHPAADTATAMLAFHLRFAERGEQRLFLEFKIAGQVRRAAFTVFVT